MDNSNSGQVQEDFGAEEWFRNSFSRLNDDDAAGGSAHSSKGTIKQKSVRMLWNKQKDLTLVGEVILARPYQFKQGTRERGKAWNDVADAMKARDIKVDKRAVRDRVTFLMEKVKKTNNKERAASGISVEETEYEKKIREFVEDLIQEEEDIESSATNLKAKELKKKQDGAEMRLQACETFGESKKRLSDEANTATPQKRNRGIDALSIIEKKMQFQQAILKEEAERRKEEEERRSLYKMEKEKKFEALQQQQLQLQQQQLQQNERLQQMLVQQSQQTQTLLLAVLKKI